MSDADLLHNADDDTINYTGLVGCSRWQQQKHTPKWNEPVGA